MIYYDVGSIMSISESMRARFFYSPIFFFLASTIHPRALIEARTAGMEYREKNLVDPSVVGRFLHASVGIVWSICGGSVLTWRDWSVGRRCKKRERGKRDATHGRADRQMDGQADRKWNVLSDELNDVFKFGCYHPSGRPVDKRDEREPSSLWHHREDPACK